MNKTNNIFYFFIFIALFNLFLLTANEIYAAENDITAQIRQIKPPTTSIRIPGLQFTERVTTTTDSEGNVYLVLPWIGEYLAAMYKYAIGVASIVAVVMLVIQGFRVVVSGGGEQKIAAYKRIGQIVIGLIIAWESYAILYFVNPDLVRFKPLQVKYIQEIPMSDDIAGEEEHIGESGSVSITDRTYRPQNINDFCFPIKDGFTVNTNNWGQRRPPFRCHAGIDLLTNYSELRGTIVSMSEGTVLAAISSFYPCRGGKSATADIGAEEPTGTVYIFDSVNNTTYIYGEINKGTIKVKTGDSVRKGQELGLATKCGMLHLEIFRGKDVGGNAYKGRTMMFDGQMKRGWLLFDEMRNGKTEIPRGNNICADNSEFYNILNITGSKILDPREFVRTIQGKSC